MSRYDFITEIQKTRTKRKPITKFNPYHDSRGRFASANRYTSFTYSPGKSKAHDKAIAREKIKSNPYRYHTDSQLKQAWNQAAGEIKRAQLKAGLTPGRATNRVITANKKKIKQLDEKIRQIEQMMAYSQKWGNDNTF